MQFSKWHVGYWTILLFLISSRNIVQSDATPTSRSSHGASRNSSRSHNTRKRKKRKTYSSRSRHFDSNSDSLVDLLGNSSSGEKEKLFTMDSSEEDKIIMALANEDDSRDYEIKQRTRSSSSSNKRKRKRTHRGHGTSSSALSSNSNGAHRKKSKSTIRVKTSKSKKSKVQKSDSGERASNDKKDSTVGDTPSSKRRNRTANTMQSSKERNDALSKHGNSKRDEKRKRTSTSQKALSSKSISRENKKVHNTSKLSSKKQPNSTWNDEEEHESTIEIIRKVREQANLNAIKTPATEESTKVGNTDVVEKKQEKGDDSTTTTTTTTNTVKQSMEQLQNGALDAKGSTATKPAVIEKKESIQTKTVKVQPPRISTTTVDGTTTTKVIPTTHKSIATASIPTINVEVSPSKTTAATPVSSVNKASIATTTHQSQTKQQQQQQQQAPPTTMSMTTPWARKFILSRPKDALLPIPREFLSDGFNLVQLGPIVEKAVQAMNLQGKDSSTIQEKEHQSPLGNLSLYKSALKLILEEADSTEETSIAYNHAIYSATQIQKAAEVLYSLVHARYVSSPRGLDTIRRMFLRNAKMNVQKKSNESRVSSTTPNTEIGAIFGRCSRIQCKGTPFLPIGLSDRYDIGEAEGQMRKAMRLCPCCRETFVMWDSRVDGAAWGTSFAYLFLMTQGSNVFGKHYGKIPGERDISHCKSNDRIFGFPIHAAAAINASN